MLSPGDKIGPYTIREKAGAGGMATVYKAWHEGLHRHEALKVPRGAGEGSADSAYVLRLLTEARVAARLQHPNIVAIHNVSEPDATVPFFAMSWVDGEDLSQILKLKKQFSLNATIEILQPVAQALDYAHSQGVVHRDIKPANILLENKNGKWIPHVVDFGISRAAEDEDGATKLTKSGMLVGTPEYMSPEQAGSGEPVDFRTDIYSLGVLAYEMICGCPPFTAGKGVSRLSILVAHVNNEAPLFQICPDFPQQVGEVLLAALAKSPSARPQSCTELMSALKAAVGQLPDGDFLPIMAGGNDDRTPFDKTRFNIDNDATIVQRVDVSAGVSPSTPLAEITNKPVTLTPPANQATIFADAPTPTPVLNQHLPVQEAVERPTGKSVSLKHKIAIAVGCASLFLAVGVVTSLTMQRLQLPATANSAIKEEKPRVEVSISPAKPIKIEEQPKAASPFRTIRVTRMREIPFETETRQSSQRLKGQTAIIQQGEHGSREVVLAIKMQGEREISRSKVSERDVLQPTKQIVEIGTRQPRPRVAVRRARVRSVVRDSTSSRVVSKPKRVVVRTASVKRQPTVVKRHYIREAPLPP